MIKNPQARARAMYDTAYGFAKCADYALENPAKEIVPNLSTASFVNTAFACELFLKALLLYTTSKNPRGHELKTLFEELPTKYQTLIETEVFRRCGGRVKTIWGLPLLDELSNAFTEWRYWFEDKRNTMRGEIGYLKNFREVLKEMCAKAMFGGLQEGGFYGTIG